MQKALWSEKGHTHSDFTQRGHYLVRLRMVGRQGRQGEGDNGVRGAVSDFHDSNPQCYHRHLAREQCREDSRSFERDLVRARHRDSRRE